MFVVREPLPRRSLVTHAVYVDHAQPTPTRLQESHTDLREWYIHCLDFRALKRRLVDDPPDPYDDHPSMMGPAPGSSSAAGAAAGSGGGGGIGASSAAVAAVDSDLDQRQALLMGGQGEEGLEAAVKGGDGGGGGGDGVWGAAAAGGGGRAVSLAFPDPASRVFVFEINEVRYGTVRYRGDMEHACFRFRCRSAVCFGHTMCKRA